MEWKVRQSFLSRVEIFANLGRRELKALAKSCTQSTYAEGDVLCRQGERGVAAFLIVSGRVQIEAELEDQRVAVVTELGQGAMVGELSIIDGAERVATVRAIEEVDALVLTQWSMMALLKTHPAIAVSMLPVIVQRFRETADELRQLNHQSNRARTSVHQ